MGAIVDTAWALVRYERMAPLDEKVVVHVASRTAVEAVAASPSG